MIADLHCHYPMHVVMHEPRHRIEHLLRMRGRLRGDQVRVAVLRVASALFNDRHMWSTERVSLEYLQHGNARLVFSVLHAPFNEWDLSRRYGAPPEDKYFATVRLQIEEVENDLDKWDDSVVTVVRDADALERALDSRAIAFVHCLEGGVSLGSSIEEIDRNVGVCRHIDELHEITGSHQYAALGTDFDGFTKPTLGGLETPADLGASKRGSPTGMGMMPSRSRRATPSACCASFGDGEVGTETAAGRCRSGSTSPSTPGG